jgi:hypothetical protein
LSSPIIQMLSNFCADTIDAERLSHSINTFFMFVCSKSLSLMMHVHHKAEVG